MTTVADGTWKVQGISKKMAKDFIELQNLPAEARAQIWKFVSSKKETKLILNRRGHESLLTTVPREICKVLDLHAGDSIVWNVQMMGDKLVAVAAPQHLAKLKKKKK